MKPIVIVVPLVIVVFGVVTYLLLPLDLRLRLSILLMDLFSAVVVGLVLWRQKQR